MPRTSYKIRTHEVYGVLFNTSNPNVYNMGPRKLHTSQKIQLMIVVFSKFVVKVNFQLYYTGIKLQ